MLQRGQLARNSEVYLEENGHNSCNLFIIVQINQSRDCLETAAIFSFEFPLSQVLLLVHWTFGTLMAVLPANAKPKPFMWSNPGGE